MGRRDVSGRISRSVDRARLEALQRLSPAGGALTREFLLHAYLDEERDICSIAREVGCRPGTVVFQLAAHGIPMRPPLQRRISPLDRRGRGRRGTERRGGAQPGPPEPGST